MQPEPAAHRKIVMRRQYRLGTESHTDIYNNNSERRDMGYIKYRERRRDSLKPCIPPHSTLSIFNLVHVNITLSVQQTVTGTLSSNSQILRFFERVVFKSVCVEHAYCIRD